MDLILTGWRDGLESPARAIEFLVELRRDDEAAVLGRYALAREPCIDGARIRAALNSLGSPPDGWHEAVLAFAQAPSVEAWDELLLFTPHDALYHRTRSALQALIRLGVDGDVLFRCATRHGTTPDAIQLIECGLVDPDTVVRRAEHAPHTARGQGPVRGCVAWSRVVFSDHRVRLATFDWLTSQVRAHGEVLPRQLLADGLVLDGRRVPLVGPQGIFKPAVLSDAPLSITTSPKGPYDDSFGPDGLLRYRYRGTDPMHHENVGLRTAMQKRLPLVYFHGILPGRYLAVWPVFVVQDHPAELAFDVAVDDVSAVRERFAETDGSFVMDDGDSARRRYITSTTRQRLHQNSFREKVLRAYREQCALCRLRHVELLDAAHIIPDWQEHGDPVVANGLALCKLHHAAFDRYFIGIRPDFRIEVRADMLREKDGPMLRHGLQGMHDRVILLPRSRELWPDPERLRQRYKEFRQAS